MGLSLRPATPSDARHIVDIYFSAFKEDAISIICFPRIKAVDDFWFNMIFEELSDPHAYFACVTSSEATGEETIVAFAKWNTPSKPMTLELPNWPEGSDGEFANSVFSRFFSVHKRLMQRRKHWYLELIATRPEFQGKGAAGMLMRWGLEKVDEDGAVSYLEASPEGKPIYEHFGFVGQEELTIDIEGKGSKEKKYVEVFMIRPAKNER
jgi:GNAT superfamily N-acetyltransferase